MKKLEKSLKKYKNINKELKNLFDKYGGVGLASIWKDIVTKIYILANTCK